MFSSIGWPEIFAILILGLIVIGPERLPGLIQDVRAAIYAARKAIHNAKAELNGDLGAEFEELRKPISEVAKWQRMGPRAAITKALFDGDEEFMDSFDPKKVMAQETAGQAHRRATGEAAAHAAPSAPAASSRRAPEAAPQHRSAPPAAAGGEFNWADIM
ncbi:MULTISPECIES: Sec-independent protein translocase subunit TatB [unclassified Corynebacterium]|uniref:Sec-independent protein translocase subunit TatB n=1 Tax=unclassified Corynebacterium TaxID=2624378 RepID=UPI0029CA5F8B|nr:MULTISPECIES: Sec-independent protein translocase subunit TatB [unclassified Corynebacterium]WPF66973.1 Sec-independent protein translocase subunit TatB [Corynebacterium sp. 22KM0430]WPF69461.1 Sec-independent protein translocase subunit TatB [Corynebacterium sp. 21KM1197]